MRSLSIFGATGSVGEQTVDLLVRAGGAEAYRVVALTGGRNLARLAEMARDLRAEVAVCAEASGLSELRERLAGSGVAAAAGPEAMAEAADRPADWVMSAIVGAAGLVPGVRALRHGSVLALANKESLVTAGPLLMAEAERHGARILPVDSEHSAIFQCLPEDRGSWASRIDHIVLTASGGPFRTRDPATLREVTPDQACAHPNWVMGRKISVDSATMMNKALEVIEARWLFDLAPEQIRVVLHPQSIIHSMVVCRDNSVLAQLGTPDMRVPIAYGLSFPQRIESGASQLDFTALAALSFEPADFLRYPGLALAWEALRAAPGSTAVLNAANEEAVAAFLGGTIRFDQIHSVNAGTVEHVVAPQGAAASLDGLLGLDAQARRHARQLIQGFTR